MSKFIIEGQKPLVGEIPVYGAKNAAIKMIAASVLVSGVTILDNVPDILDIQKIIAILEKMGAKFQRSSHHLEIDTRALKASNPDPTLVAAIRASIVLVGPLLARFGTVSIPHPGGCTIGSRPIDLHIKAFRDLGVEVTEGKNIYTFRATHQAPGPVVFSNISVTATENILLFASAQEEKITIKNAAIEPEVLDLIVFLSQAGAKIAVQDRTIKIEGTKNLKAVKHRVIPDRIEAGTFAILAAATKNDLKITQMNPKQLTALLEKFSQMGIAFKQGEDFLEIKSSEHFSSINISTAEYPGFPTDLQSPMGLLLSQAQGQSRIKENLFEHRLGYLKELQKMGGNVRFLNPQEAEISGPTPLYGARLESLDLRAGATLLIAGLIAQGRTEIKHAENIDRGYEKIEERLRAVGARIKRVS